MSRYSHSIHLFKVYPTVDVKFFGQSNKYAMVMPSQDMPPIKSPQIRYELLLVPSIRGPDPGAESGGVPKLRVCTSDVTIKFCVLWMFEISCRVPGRSPEWTGPGIRTRGPIGSDMPTLVASNILEEIRR